MLWTLRLVPVVVALALASAATALGAPGDLDKSFDGDGFRVIDFSGSDYADTVLVQPDGKLVAAGGGTVASDFTVARLNLDGSLDTTFSQTGTAAVDLGGADFGSGAALQSDGKLVIGGYTSPTAGTAANMGFVRLTPGGSTDSSFDGDGRLVVDFGGDDSAYDVLVQPDGKLVAAGAVFSQLAIARRNPDGSSDGGAKLVNFPGTFDRALGVALQPGGEIVVAGSTGSAMLGTDMAVARFDPDRSLDTTFYGIGWRTIDLGGTVDEARSVLIQPDGKILLIGEGYSDSSITVTRLTRDGSLDSGFAADGTARIDVGLQGRGYAAVLQANGKIVVAGSGAGQPALVRLQPGGALDTTFGNGGSGCCLWRGWAEGSRC